MAALQFSYSFVFLFFPSSYFAVLIRCVKCLASMVNWVMSTFLVTTQRGNLADMHLCGSRTVRKEKMHSGRWTVQP